ncbi:MAG TPA: DUF5946 family protein [Ktedonobacterales bacterium]|nr:DUF5946 family protein [Ktedonobacterales bacterium]
MGTQPHSSTRACSVCPGCGARLPISADAHPDARYNASVECWQLYGELTAYTVTCGDWEGDGEFIHQLAVDVYGAQHVGETPRPIGPAFALIGLYLTCERGYTGRQVQHLHTLLANRSKTWPRFTPPLYAGALTVADVMRAPEGEARDARLRKWGHSVWEAWEPEHERVRALFERVMGN